MRNRDFILAPPPPRCGKKCAKTIFSTILLMHPKYHGIRGIEGDGDKRDGRGERLTNVACGEYVEALLKAL